MSDSKLDPGFSLCAALREVSLIRGGLLPKMSWLEVLESLDRDDSDEIDLNSR